LISLTSEKYNIKKEIGGIKKGRAVSGPPLLEEVE
jgi:hypothetical protein